MFYAQLTFEGVRGSDYHGDIALDDIALKSGRCPKPLFECDFQDPNSCGFAQVGLAAFLRWLAGSLICVSSRFPVSHGTLGVL